MKRNYCWTFVGIVAIAFTVAFSGCQSNPSSKPSARQGPAASQLGGQATVSTSGSTTTITGSGRQPIPAINFDLGAYIVDWTSTGVTMEIFYGDASKRRVGDIGLGEAKGEAVFLVNNDPVKQGAINLHAYAEGPWTIAFTKVDAAAAVELPMTLSGAESKSVISKPFRAKSGKLTVTYTFKGTPRYNGVLNFWNVTTGKSLWITMMSAGVISGKSDFSVPTDGVFIAEMNFPLASGGGDVDISQ